MTTGDRSQWPIERLAQFLLERAREDASLQCRSAANDDDMVSRLAALPAMRVEEPVTLPELPTPDKMSLSDLESLVALALESAQDAEDLSRDVQEATRRARRGMVAAIGIGIVSLAVALASAMSGRLMDRGAGAHLADIAGQVTAIATLQRHIDQQLQSVHLETEAPAAGAAPATSVAAHPDVTLSRPSDVQSTLPPVETEAVRALPATPAQPLRSDFPNPAGMNATPAVGQAGAYPATITAYATESGPIAGAYSPYQRYHPPWVPHRHPTRYYPVRLPRPVALLIGSMQRDLRVLFYR